MGKKLFYLTCLVHTTALISQESWNVDMDGDWGVAGNWTPAVVPNGSAATATLGNKITMPRVITLATVGPTVGTIFFDNANAYTIQQMSSNALTVASALTITNVNGNGAHVIAAPVTMNAQVAISQGSTAAGGFTISGLISGSGGIVLSAGVNTNSLVLSAANNNYSGGTTINSGTLKCGIASTLPSGGTVTLSGAGILDLNAFTQTIGALSSSSTMSNVDIAGAQLISNTASTTTFSGTITGAGGSLLLQGTGLLNLGNTNTYNGGTVITGSTLQLGVNDGLLTTGDLTVTSPGAFDLNNFSQTIATLNTSSGNISLGTTGGNFFIVTQAMAATYSGVISGAGTFEKDGAATLTINGANNYTGNTHIAMGILQCGAVNTLPVGVPIQIDGALNLNNFSQSIGALTGAGNITLGSATLTVTLSSMATYSGVISGTGALITGGTGALTLDSQSTFSGGVTINAGMLQCGTADVFNVVGLDQTVTVNSPGLFDLNGFNQHIGIMSGDGTINLEGALTTNTATNSTFSGPLIGSGSFVKQGTSTLILLGSNNYAGGTTISAGTLQGNTTSLQGPITNNATLVFDQAASATFSGTLSGGGTFIKQNAGNLTLTGAHTQGTSTVVGGKLTINGTYTMSPGTLTVNPPAFLGGTGTILGDVVVNGTMQPGASIGTTTVMGTYTQGAGSSLQIELSPGTSDKVVVSGAVTIDSAGSLAVALPEPGPYLPSQSYTIISSGSTVTGSFGSVQVNNPFFHALAQYTAGPPGSVDLILQIIPFSDVIVGGNAGEVAKCINASSFPDDPDFLSIIQVLLFTPIPEVQKALDEMQPSQLKGLVLAEESNMVRVRTTITQRLDELYKAACCPDPHHWTMWTNISGDFMEQGHEEDNVGFRATSGSATLGLDRVMTDHFTVGAAGAYNYTSLTWDHSRGDGSVSSAYVGPYANWFGRRAFVNFSALATWNVYQAVRHIQFPGLDRKASSDHHGFGALGHLDTGLILYPGGDVTIRPFISFDYALLHENGFSETGAQSLDLDVQSSNSHLWRGEAGFSFAKCVTRGGIKWVNDIKASYVREQRPGGEHYTAGFKNHDCSFTVSGLHPDRDLFDFAIGVTGYFFEDRLTTSLRYEGQYGHSIIDQTGFLQVAYRF